MSASKTTLAEQFKLPWPERDLEWIAKHQQAAIAYHGLPPLPDGAVLGGPGVSGAATPFDGWSYNSACAIATRWERGRWIGNCDDIFYAYEATSPPFRKDPPESEWPAPFSGFRWEPMAPVTKPQDTPHGYAVLVNGDWTVWNPKHALGKRTASHGDFYLRAVPLPTERVPFDGPQDFECEPFWVKSNCAEDPLAVISVTKNGVQAFNLGFIPWGLLCRTALYSDSIKGPWRPFTKPPSPAGR